MRIREALSIIRTRIHDHWSNDGKTNPENAVWSARDEEGEALVPGAAHLNLGSGVVHDGIQPIQARNQLYNYNVNSAKQNQPWIWSIRIVSYLFPKLSATKNVPNSTVRYIIFIYNPKSQILKKNFLTKTWVEPIHVNFLLQLSCWNFLRVGTVRKFLV